MKIIIAGGCGYIGTKLVTYLLNKNHYIKVIDIQWFGNKLSYHDNLEIVKKKLEDLNNDDLKDFEQFIFLAGLSNDPMAEFSPSLNFMLNTGLPTFLAYLCKKNNIKRFIFASSGSVYGFSNEDNFNEETNKICDTPYGLSKYFAEQNLMKLNDKNFSVICLRQGTLAGFSSRMRLDLVINKMFSDALNTNCVNINNPNIYRPILSINDAIKGYEESVNAKYDVSGIFNIASFNISLKNLGLEIKHFLTNKLNKNISLNINNNTNEIRSYRMSWEKAKNILNYNQCNSLDNILEDLYENLDNFKDFDNNNYYNILRFKNIFLN